MGNLVNGLFRPLLLYDNGPNCHFMSYAYTSEREVYSNRLDKQAALLHLSSCTFAYGLLLQFLQHCEIWLKEIS